VESVLRGAAAPNDFREAEPETQPASDGQIVIVRPRVVEDIGHVLGNLFQRLYHLIAQVNEGGPDAALQLDASTRQLEDFLQLVVDYFAPLSLSLTHVSAMDTLQSVARQISDALGGSVRIDARVPIEGPRLLVDPARLARGFALLASQLCPRGGNAGTILIQAAERPLGRAMTISVWIPPGLVSVRSSVAEVQWAVVEKILEVHGGALREQLAPSGEVQWQIVLPLQS
jgi:hypothetical protein